MLNSKVPLVNLGDLGVVQLIIDTRAIEACWICRTRGIKQRGTGTLWRPIVERTGQNGVTISSQDSGRINAVGRIGVVASGTERTAHAMAIGVQAPVIGIHSEATAEGRSRSHCPGKSKARQDGVILVRLQGGPPIGMCAGEPGGSESVSRGRAGVRNGRV